MKLQLISQGFALTPALRRHLERRLAFALGRFGHEVSQVWARVADTNGPKGGVDKVVAIHAHVNRAPAIIVTHAAADYYEAVTAAARRLKAVLGRRLHRRR